MSPVSYDTNNSDSPLKVYFLVCFTLFFFLVVTLHIAFKVLCLLVIDNFASNAHRFIRFYFKKMKKKKAVFTSHLHLSSTSFMGVINGYL